MIFFFSSETCYAGTEVERDGTGHLSMTHAFMSFKFLVKTKDDINFIQSLFYIYTIMSQNCTSESSVSTL